MRPVNGKELSTGERLLILRRRRGQSQKQAAEALGVSLYCYRQWESDEQAETDPPKVRSPKLALHEQCFLRRVRAGLSLADLAGELGLSRWWVCKMEQGKAPPERLLEHWGIDAKPWRPSLASSAS